MHGLWGYIAHHHQQVCARPGERQPLLLFGWKIWPGHLVFPLSLRGAADPGCKALAPPGGREEQGLVDVGKGVADACVFSSWARFEQAYVNSLIYSWEDEYFWTALQDMNETGSFRWLSGDEVAYTHWNRNQPGKNCLCLSVPEAG